MSPRRANLTEDGEDQEEVINLDVPQALGIPEFDEDKRRPNSTRNKRNQLEESNSLDHSGKRLVGDPRAKYADDTMDIILQHANLDSPDNTTDEKDVLGKKKKKRKKKHSAAPELFSKG